MSKMSNFRITDFFANRHIGPNAEEQSEMLQYIASDSLDDLMADTIPAAIRLSQSLPLPEAISEYEYLRELRGLASKNKVFRTYIGRGYFGTWTPSVINRSIFQNPGWYTQYTPYQAEIAQGRLEALLNFQTMVSDLTRLPVANASLLDEGTAAAEAMTLFFGVKNKKNKVAVANQFLVSDKVLPQTIAVLQTRAEPIGIEIIVKPVSSFELTAQTFGILLQYPDSEGNLLDFSSLTAEAKSKEIYVTAACDLMSLALLEAPGDWGADCAIGNAQRFGVPLGFGGPHAAFFAISEEFKRLIPGRIIGVSIDKLGNKALRMALQTREQHIRREKATSNICTAQALLAIMASMYAVYHGPKGIYQISKRIHDLTCLLAANLQKLGINAHNPSFFDTLSINGDTNFIKAIQEEAEKNKINFFYGKETLQISLDETVLLADVLDIFNVFKKVTGKMFDFNENQTLTQAIQPSLQRKSSFLTHPVFNTFHTESKMMRYIRRLENKDLSLVHAMISLGSCTMKLNAASELLPVSWPEFANIHPLVPENQAEGYQELFENLEKWLCAVTGFTACSLQPNSGAQGEYAGLLTIRKYFQYHNQTHRNIALIPSSAHGTNPASAVMAGMKVVVVDCDANGNVNFEDLQLKASAHADHLAVLMVTYPSTHGVFETRIKEIVDLIHHYGGRVYLDGANMNAQVGLTSPGYIGADVCHLNLHKTFAIPHGGGGPGMGPICVNNDLAPFLPGKADKENAGYAVSAATYGSASILLISYAYIKMLGAEGVTQSTRIAILNANYIKNKLENDFDVLYLGEKGRSAHELILDLRPFKQWISAEDLAKRLIDYGFHAPTLSFPVAGTIMIEPTESEDKDELDRFCLAMLEIKKEIVEIMNGVYEVDNNVLHNAPHTQALITANEWSLPYSREKAAFPLPYLHEGYKFWPSVARIDGAFGDRNLVCTCPPLSEYAES
jgi:glycine dehydrogenase